ncbi:MAG: GIY-YIG nuclease family protein [Candidatus Portnoybacteria bacterium]|nr:GIY-YIG nuclease family protein [Candidatus Portnoybacteria bacterium]
MNAVNLKRFPLSPGVYLFKDCKNRIIYVGRASVLRKRIASYFAKHLTDPRISQMVNAAKKIDFRKTANLLEAVILEANLIKKYWPKYNIREKDNRSFIYIVIQKKEWMYPLIIRGQQLNKYEPKEAHIFGPFKSYATAKNLLLLLRKIFPWSTCKLNQKRPCFYYQIGLCPGKCTGAINEKEYKKIIDNLILLLKGGKDKIKRMLKKTKPEKLKLLGRIDDSILIARENNFLENDSLWKNSSPSISRVSPRKNRSPHIGRIEGYDISHFAGKEIVGAMVVWQDEDFDKSQYRLFKIRTARPNDDLAALEETIARRLRHKEWPYPDLILVDGGKTQVKTVEKVLAEYKINIPVVGVAKPPDRRHNQSFSYHHEPRVKDLINKGGHADEILRFTQNDKHGDKLVFGKTQKTQKDLISLSLPQLLKIRNETHRFANSLRKKLLKKKIK